MKFSVDVYFAVIHPKQATYFCEMSLVENRDIVVFARFAQKWITSFRHMRGPLPRILYKAGVMRKMYGAEDRTSQSREREAG